jgi:hypothetical protein
MSYYSIPIGHVSVFLPSLVIFEYGMDIPKFFNSNLFAKNNALVSFPLGCIEWPDLYFTSFFAFGFSLLLSILPSPQFIAMYSVELN